MCARGSRGFLKGSERLEAGCLGELGLQVIEAVSFLAKSSDRLTRTSGDDPLRVL